MGKRILFDLLNRLGTPFQDIELYERTFRHISHARQEGLGEEGSFEQLEFVGDRFVAAIVAEYLAECHPKMQNRSRAPIIEIVTSNFYLAKIGRQLDLISHLTTGENLETLNYKVHADLMEALIYAIKKGRGYDAMKIFVDEVIVRDMDRSICADQYVEHNGQTVFIPCGWADAVGRLRIMYSRDRLEMPTFEKNYVESDKQGKVVMQAFNGDHVVAVGFGRIQRIAEHEAAKSILAKKYNQRPPEGLMW